MISFLLLHGGKDLLNPISNCLFMLQWRQMADTKPMGLGFAGERALGSFIHKYVPSSSQQ